MSDRLKELLQDPKVQEYLNKIKKYIDESKHLIYKGKDKK